MPDRTVADIIADECIHDDADLATLQAMLDENERLRAELRRFQRIIIDASEATADCEDLCGVLCAGPCQGLDEIAAISQAAGLDELTGEPPIRRPYPLVGPHQGDPMTEHSEDFVMVEKSVVGGLTANVKRWRNRASAERLKRQRWRKRALAAEAEVKRLWKIEIDALWLARLACSSSWPMEMAQQVENAAERVRAAFSDGKESDRG